MKFLVPHPHGSSPARHVLMHIYRRIPCLRFPNVQFTHSLSSSSRVLQALAQPSTTPLNHPICSSFPRIPSTMETDILPVSPENLGRITFKPTADDLVDEWHIEWANDAVDVQNLQRAAYELATTNNPVGFPTETVYGLGADATKGEAVRAIFQAKGRPADNPLIVHFSSIKQLRGLLKGRRSTEESDNGVQAEEGEEQDPIPEIYKPLIRKFWPGPLTIILPNPEDSLLAPEVTAGLNTFGARMPRSILALALIDMAGCPLAAPSANASTRPSPTAAEHVKDDLNGRIHTIIDGGPCNVGVESTVVDGLSSPPAILRPGGVTMEQLRQCPGWENVVVGYKDKPEHGIRPRAPGMKYRHYSPKAMVVLYETGATLPSPTETFEQIKERKSVGIIRTKTWPKALGLAINEHIDGQANGNEIAEKSNSISNPINTTEPSNSLAAPSNLLLSITQHQVPHAHHYALSDSGIPHAIDVWDIDLGAQADGVARGLFSALRELDKKGVDMIFVEGVDDREGGDIAAAVMNRLRKAAEVRI